LPTAVQAEAEVHETPMRPFSSRPLMVGLGTIDQAVPFHCSTRVWPVDAIEPTATQTETEAHETASRVGPEPLVVGLGAIDQAVPFHCSMSDCPERPLGPTAKHAEAEAHETPLSESPFSAGVALVFGLDTIDQAVPFHCSIRVLS
jgi:hypothetical protein